MLMGELVGGEFVCWPSQTVFGKNRNPKESGEIRRNPEESVGIRRNLVQRQELFLGKWLKTGIFKTPLKPRSCEKNPPKKKQGEKEILMNPGRNKFWGSQK